MRYAILFTLTLVAACGDKSTGPGGVNLPGTWVLVSAGGTPLPNSVAHSGRITFNDGGSYEAQTCYGSGAPPCQLARNEAGTFSLAGAVVSLTAGGYTRSLTVSANALTQSGSGDTGNVTLVYRK